MQGPVPLNACWGKLAHAIPGDRSSPVTAWHPLADHSADVAACCVALLGWRPNGFSPTILNRRLARMGGLDVLDEVHVARIGVLAGLHDLGKCNRGFQNKARGREPFAGHVGEVMALLEDPDLRQPFLRGIEWGELESWFEEPEAATSALIACISHHGRPAEPASGGVRPALWLPDADLDPVAYATRLALVIRGYLPASTAQRAVLPASTTFVHGLAGLVQLADWLGSDTALFPFSDGTSRWPFALEAAQRAVTGIGLDATAAHLALTDPPTFAQLSSFAPRPMQAAVAALPLPDRDGSLTLIEDETGAGKTEAALLHFARIFQAGMVDGLYFALPTRTAAIQIQRRVQEMVDRLWPNRCGPSVVLAVPGYLRVGEAEGRSLPGFQVLWNDRQRDPTRWAAEHPKRFLAGTMVVGTIDQVLLSTLAVEHSHLRAASLLRHLLVVDEVHASDAYMGTLLAEVLSRHRQAGGHALLLSATLGSIAAVQFMSGRAAIPPALSEASATEYPRLSVAGFPSIAVSTQAQKPPVSLGLHPSLAEPAWIADAALIAARAGARVLVLRNTVSGCLAVQAELERQDDGRCLWRVDTPHGPRPAPHHARFAREDREHLDLALERMFGKEANRHGGLVCCATQTVQQSLDLDADLLITDLCPMDVLLQRIGRLHRHARTDRAAGFTMPRCVVLVPDQGPADLLSDSGKSRVRDGLGTVYADLAIIAATWTELKQRARLCIPNDNRALVEAATHPEALKPWHVLDDRWSRHANQLLGVGIQHRQQAKGNRARWDLHWYEPDVRFPSRALDERIATRLGEGDRRIELATGTRGPFGQCISALTAPAWLLRGVPWDVAPVVTCHTQCVQLAIADRRLRYDRLGLRPITGDAEDDHADA